MKQAKGFYISLIFLSLFVSIAIAQPPVTGSRQMQLNEYNSLMKILSADYAGTLKDTVLIKYQYNDTTSQAKAGNTNDEIIQQNITSELRRLHLAMTKRKNISILHITETGDATASLKDYNNLVIEDTGNKIQQLLFKNGKRANSVMLLPGRQIICIDSSDGWATLQLTANDISKILASPSLAALH